MTRQLDNLCPFCGAASIGNWDFMEEVGACPWEESGFDPKAVDHSDTIVKDGAMYQQYKLEGKNLQNTNSTLVLQYAIDFERYIRGDYAEMANMLVGGDFSAWLEGQLKASTEKWNEVMSDNVPNPPSAP